MCSLLRSTFCFDLIKRIRLRVLSVREWSDQRISIAVYINQPSRMPHTGLQNLIFLVLHPALPIRSLQLNVFTALVPPLVLTRPVVMILPVPAGFG